MKLSCLIVDDEPNAVSVLLKHTAKIPFLEVVYSSTNPSEANAYLATHSVDIVFSDIQMPEISGVDLLQLHGHKACFIMTTGFREYALDGYEYGAVDYLVKPITFDRLLKAVQKAKQWCANAKLVTENTDANANIELEHIFLKTGKGLMKMDVADICYVQAQEHYVKIFDKHHFVLCFISLGELEKKLPQSRFLRISRSIMVAIRQIKSVQYDAITLEPPYEQKLKIGITYREKVLQLVTLGK